MLVQVLHRQKADIDEAVKSEAPGEESARTPLRIVLKRPVMTGYACIPAIDMFTVQDYMILRMDLPGVKKEDVEISATENRLSISGQRKPANDINREDYRINEVSYGYFSRNFNLPVSIDSSRIEASLEAGILEITLPKLAKDRFNLVPIKTKEQ